MTDTNAAAAAAAAAANTPATGAAGKQPDPVVTIKCSSCGAETSTATPGADAEHCVCEHCGNQTLIS